MKRRLALIGLVLIAAVTAIFYARTRSSANEAEAAGALLVSGNIEAHESLVSFKVPGRLIELPVEEGQWVEAGAVLARIEPDDYRQQAELDEAALRVRQAELKLALAGARPQEVEAAQQALEAAKAELEQRQLDYARAETLYKQEVGPKQARDQAETNLRRAQANYQQAQEQYEEVREGTRKEQIEIAKAAAQQAREKLRLSRLNVDYTTLRAPKAGVISVRQAELGEVVSPGTPVVTLADLENVWLRAYIAETDLGRVRWGQPAVVRTDTYPEKSYRGKISFISPRAEFTPKTVQTHKERVTLVYRIKIDVENPNHELKPGMPADAEIRLASHP